MQTLRLFEYIIDTTPWVLNKSHYADEIQLYRDAQIRYGMQQAQAAENTGNLVHAYVWYVQTSLVDAERAECGEAAGKALGIRKRLSDEFLRQADTLRASGRVTEAFARTVQGLWYQDRDSAEVALNEGLLPGVTIPPSVFDPVKPADVSGFVRTDSLERLTANETFAPYGIPIYFGDIPRYYVRLGTVQVEGAPIPKRIPAEYANFDGLAKLSLTAQKRFAPDALINVRYWTKSTKAFTQGEAVRFVSLPPASNHLITYLESSQKAGGAE